MPIKMKKRRRGAEPKRVAGELGARGCRDFSKAPTLDNHCACVERTDGRLFAGKRMDASSRCLFPVLPGVAVAVLGMPKHLRARQAGVKPGGLSGLSNAESKRTGRIWDEAMKELPTRIRRADPVRGQG